jgi:ATP-dependent DNA helicase RecG
MYLCNLKANQSDMTIQEIKRLRETENKVEFKEAKRDFNFAGGKHTEPAERRKCVLGYVVALANEGGGLLIFGVRESKKLPHEIVGTAFAENGIGALADEIYKRLSIRVEIEEVFDNGNRVLVFHIPSRPIGSTLRFEGVPLMRIGDSLRVMSDAEIFRILSEREPDFSATICDGLTFEDLDPEAITIMKERYGIKQENLAFKTLPDMQILSDLELTEKDKFNYAALLLLGTQKALRKYLPNAAVTIEYRLDHSMIPYTARQEFQEPLFKLIDKIWAYINQPASNPLLHIRDKFNIYDIKSFNEEVIREAVINACVHRSYSFSDDVFIKQYPDEIVITNAGGFPPGVSKDNILIINSRPRSKRLTEVLQKTGFIERSGQGVDKMFYLCVMESKPLPDYSHTDITQVDLRLKTKIIDNAFYLFVNKIQSDRIDKLNVFDLLTLDKVRQGISTDLFEASVEKLQHEGLIKSQSSADKYILSDLYYELMSISLKDYKIRDLQIISHCFEKRETVTMGDFVEAFNTILSRGQVKYLMLKLEKNIIVSKVGGGRYTQYRLDKSISPNNIFIQLVNRLSK